MARSVGSGDFDFYAVDATVGDQLIVDIDTPVGDLDSVVVLLDAAGNFIALNDDNIAANELDSLLIYRVSAAGRYYVVVGGFGPFLPDPFDSGSGVGAGSEGPYDVTITAGAGDDDVFAVHLRKGDVLGGSVAGAATLLSPVRRRRDARRGFGPGRHVHLPDLVAAARRRQRRRRPRRRRDGLALRRGERRPRRLRHHGRGLPATAGAPRAPCRRCSSTSTGPGSTPRSGAVRACAR